MTFTFSDISLVFGRAVTFGYWPSRCSWLGFTSSGKYEEPQWGYEPRLAETLSLQIQPRDEETGYSYFGARYYDAGILTGWLSVDPMADKYPSLSPYNYCAWNPIMLEDPNGMVIDSSSVSQNIWNMVDPNHECYNEDFALVFEELNSDQSTTYKFDLWSEFHKNERGQEISGNVSVDDNGEILISYTWGMEDPDRNTDERALCEEVYHAKQFCDGDYGFAKYQYDQTNQWRVFGYDKTDEDKAHQWADAVCGRIGSYSLEEYSIPGAAMTAEMAWEKVSPKTRSKTRPAYIDGLYKTNDYFFKQPQQ